MRIFVTVLCNFIFSSTFSRIYIKTYFWILIVFFLISLRLSLTETWSQYLYFDKCWTTFYNGTMLVTYTDSIWLEILGKCDLGSSQDWEMSSKLKLCVGLTYLQQHSHSQWSLKIRCYTIFSSFIRSSTHKLHLKPLILLSTLFF